MLVDPLFVLVVRAGIAVLFMASALHKLWDWRRIGAVIAGYRIFPSGTSQLVGAIVVSFELAIAVGSLITVLALHAAAALLTAYAAVIAFNIVRGNDRIDCGCLGFGARVPRLKWIMVGRNCVIGGLVELVAVLDTTIRSLSWIDFLSLGGALLGLALLYAAFETAIALPDRGVTA